MKYVIKDLRREFARLYESSEDSDAAYEFMAHLDMDSGLCGDPDDFHNFATELARADYYEAACDVLKQGIIIYPTDPDLLADYIMYASKCGRNDLAKEMYLRLRSLELMDWTWRGFVFSIDYHLALLKGQRGEVRQQTEDRISQLIDEFKRMIPEDEKAYLAEFDFYEATGRRVEALEILRKVVDAGVVKVCTQCCLRYVERSLGRGEYEEVSKYAQKGIAMTEAQESVETTAFWYFWALAEDHKWCSVNLDAIEPNQDGARRVIRLYDTVQKLNPNSRFNSNCKKRRVMLASFAGLSLKEEDKIPDVAKLLEMIRNQSHPMIE